jgi:Tol biopolymer transport system component
MRKRVAALLAFSVLTAFTILITTLHSQKITLSGTLIYHRYTDYQSWDATMWTIDLATGKQMQVNKDWHTMISPINAHFSPDGQTITFMGSAAGLSDNDWDVFTSHWNGASWDEPINLTGPNGARDEDPKFSPIDTTIIYKEDGVLVTMNIDGSDKTYLTKGEAESSMPYFSPDGKGILFERSGDIYLRANGSEKKMYAGDGQSSYYPIGLDKKSFLYTRVQNSKHDAIMKGNYDGSPSTSYFFNSPDWDTSDSYPYQDGSRFIFYVSGDYFIPHGGYNLALADLKTHTRWNIDQWFKGRAGGDINTEFAELGPAWSPVIHSKP